MDVRFETTLFGEGYDMEEVDDFLDRCERALATRDGSVTAESVARHRFTPTRFREGYDMDAVDLFLDEQLVPRFAAIERGEEPEPLPGADPQGVGSGASVGDPGPAQVASPAAPERDPATGRLLGASAGEDRPGLLERLLGRRR